MYKDTATTLPDRGQKNSGGSALLLLALLIPTLPACAGTQLQRFERAVLGAAKTVTAARRVLVVHGKAYTEAVVRNFKDNPSEGRRKLDEWHDIAGQAASAIEAADGVVEEGYVVSQALEAGVATQPQTEAWVRLAADALAKLRAVMDAVRKAVYPPTSSATSATTSAAGGAQ